MVKKQNNKKSQSQLELLMEFFKDNPNRDIPHPEIVDWATTEWLKRTGNVFRDPDRGVRQLHQKGYLGKVKKGVYYYNPDGVKQRKLENFSKVQKTKILERDNYKCVICGHGKKEGVDLHVDHIKPKDLGGQATVENGQTLCAQHNFIKKNLKQTENGKKMFLRLYDLSKSLNDNKLTEFVSDILKVYEKHHVNSHIEWKQ